MYKNVIIYKTIHEKNSINCFEIDIEFYENSVESFNVLIETPCEKEVLAIVNNLMTLVGWFTKDDLDELIQSSLLKKNPC